MANHTEFTFTWKITQVSNFQVRKNESQLSSPSFRIEGFEGIEWKLCFNPPGKSSRDWTACYLFKYPVEKDSPEFAVTVSISGLVSQRLESAGNYNIEEGNLGWERFVRNDELLAHMNNCPDDTLIVKCRIKSEKNLVVGGYEVVSYLWTVDIYRIPAIINEQVSTVAGRIPLTTRFVIMEDILYSEITSPSEAIEGFKCEMCALHQYPIQIVKKGDFFRDETNRWSCNIAFLHSHDLIYGAVDPLRVKIDFLHPKEFKTDSSNERNVMTALFIDFQNMFTNHIQSDIKLQVAGQVLPAHKCILASRSPVFATMLEQDMVETNLGIIEISDCDLETLHMFLLFLYAGKFDSDAEYPKVLQLYLLAEKYQVFSLKDTCSIRLMSLLSQANICDVLTASDMVNDSALKTAAIAFIETNASTIIKSPEWYQWVKTNIILSTEVYAKLSERFN